MPDRAVVCRCNGVTKGDIVGCGGTARDASTDVAAATRATTGCGGCKDAVCGIVDWLSSTDPDQPAPATAATSDARDPPRRPLLERRTSMRRCPRSGHAQRQCRSQVTVTPTVS